jgi:hypothetical protein
VVCPIERRREKMLSRRGRPRGGKIKMITDPRPKAHHNEGDGDKRRRQEEALDDALKNTFPASDPVSIEQPRKTS